MAQQKENKSYRLPTEAEWEYACRAGTTTRYFSGDDPETLAKVGNVADGTYKATFPQDKFTIKASDGYVFTAPVGQFKSNAFGLYDMHGNAWQWCADWCGDDYYGKSPADDPKGPHTGDVRDSGGFLGRRALRRPFRPSWRSRAGWPVQRRHGLPRCQESVMGGENGTRTVLGPEKGTSLILAKRVRIISDVLFSASTTVKISSGDLPDVNTVNEAEKGTSLILAKMARIISDVPFSAFRQAWPGHRSPGRRAVELLPLFVAGPKIAAGQAPLCLTCLFS